MFRIKICGVTTAKDAQLIALAGADAIGLNFYPASSRYVDPASAQKIVAVISPKLSRVGVFVNSPAETVVELADQLKLDWIQLHGDETPEFLEKLRGRSILKAFRIGLEGWNPVDRFLRESKQRGVLPSAVLVDSAPPGEFGGSGQTLDWDEIHTGQSVLSGLPLVLAGGLTPFNVAEAISIVKPAAVDVASGVESKAGVKDLMLIRAFITSSKKALDLVGR